MRGKGDIRDFQDETKGLKVPRELSSRWRWKN